VAVQRPVGSRRQGRTVECLVPAGDSAR
jgi:hypothetical protein